MIKLVLSGIWVCLVTLLSTYAAVSWHAAQVTKADAPKVFANLESVKTKMISVPVVAEGAIHGYVIAQFVYTVDGEVMKRLSVKPDVFVQDEAFRVIYGGQNVDFRHFRKQDLPGLAKQITAGVNKRLGVDVIHDVLVQELNYLDKSEVRGGTGKR
jgi:hypothetical protein